MKTLARSLILISALFVQSAYALDKKTFCMYDPVGTNGPVITFFTPMVATAMSWGYDIELIAYTDEKVASNDFKAGLCDATYLTGILSRQYIQFGGTLDAIGGILDMNGLNKLIKSIASPKASQLLVTGNYELAASFPIGSVYLFVNDRNIDSVAGFSGKKISVLNEDPQMLRFTELAGASPVGTTLATFSGQFNNGNTDIVPMVALGYNIFELYHGLGEKGGIIDQKIYYGMMQMIIHRDRFKEGFGNTVRNYTLTRLNDVHKMVEDAEKDIPEKYWIKTDDKTRLEIDKFAKQIRVSMREDQVNHPVALKLMWKIRCSNYPTRSECGEPE